MLCFNCMDGGRDTVYLESPFQRSGFSGLLWCFAEDMDDTAQKGTTLQGAGNDPDHSAPSGSFSVVGPP